MPSKKITARKGSKTSSSVKRARSRRNKLLKTSRAKCNSIGKVYDIKSKSCRAKKQRSKMSLSRRRSANRKAQAHRRAMASVLKF